MDCKSAPSGIHQNPVKEKIVSNSEDYYFSSARNYNDLEVCMVFID
ncbi:hypothetical protein [Tenacibaculum sp. Bg11-29]